MILPKDKQKDKNNIFNRILWYDFGSKLQARCAQLLSPYTCVCAAGTKFGTDQTSTDVYELSLSYLSIGKKGNNVSIFKNQLKMNFLYELFSNLFIPSLNLKFLSSFFHVEILKQCSGSCQQKQIEDIKYGIQFMEGIMFL